MARRGDGGEARSARGARAGVTLLELLLVMAIMALLLGAGVGVFATADNDDTLAVSVLRSGLRTAQSAAHLEGLPAALLVQDGGRRLVLATPRVRGSWHFERETPGFGEQPPAIPLGDPERVPGYLGEGFDFTGLRADAGVAVPLHDSGAFDVTDGFAIGVALRCRDDLDGTIWRLGDVAGLESERGGRLSAWMVPGTADDPTGQRRGGRVDLELPPNSLPLGRWTRVDVVYDRFELRVLVDGFPAGILPLEDPLPRLKGPLVVGGRPRPFQGVVDELVVGTYERGDPLELSQGLVWVGKPPTAARFEADGGLDRTRHGPELVWTVETADGERHSVRVTAYGTVE